MTNAILTACRERYAAYAELVRIGRTVILKHAAETPNIIRPYVALSMELVENLDTFSNDTSVWQLTFELHGKSLAPTDAGLWLVQMERAFEDANLVDAAGVTYTCNGTRMIGAQSQTVTAIGDAWDAQFSILLYATWIGLNPAVRGV